MLKPRHPCLCLAARLYLEINTGDPWVWGAGEKDYIFQGFEEQTYSFGILGALQKSKKISLLTLTLKETPSFHLIFFNSSASEGKPPYAPPPPPGKSKCIYFRALTCYSALVLVEVWRMIFTIADLLSLKLLFFRLIIMYFGTLRLRQLAPF